MGVPKGVNLSQKKSFDQDSNEPSSQRSNDEGRPKTSRPDNNGIPQKSGEHINAALAILSTPIISQTKVRLEATKKRSIPYTIP